MSSSSDNTINIIVPSSPIPAAYHKILASVPSLIAEHAPDLIIHIGLDVDSEPGVFKLERSAAKEGYHDIPDIERRVLTRAENKKLFGKAPESLITSLDIDTVEQEWKVGCLSFSLPTINSGTKGKGKKNAKQMVDVRLSDDVGTYVCGLNYYVSLLEMQKLTGKREVVFLHVPRLEGDEEIGIGVRVVEELVKELVAVTE